MIPPGLFGARPIPAFVLDVPWCAMLSVAFAFMERILVLVKFVEDNQLALSW